MIKRVEKKMTITKTVGLISILCGILNIVVGVTHFLMPAEQLHFAHGATSDFFLSLAENATAFHVHYWCFVIASILTIGVIYIITDQLNLSSFHRYTSILAIISLSVTSYDFARMHHQAMQLTQKFISADTPIKELILIQGLDRIDAYGIGFNLLGLYLIFLCYQAYRKKYWPRYISIIGFLAGVLLQLVLVGTFAGVGILIDITSGLSGVILIPIFLFGIGFYYLKDSSAP